MHSCHHITKKEKKKPHAFLCETREKTIEQRHTLQMGVKKNHQLNECGDQCFEIKKKKKCFKYRLLT